MPTSAAILVHTRTAANWHRLGSLPPSPRTNTNSVFVSTVLCRSPPFAIPLPHRIHSLHLPGSILRVSTILRVSIILRQRAHGAPLCIHLLTHTHSRTHTHRRVQFDDLDRWEEKKAPVPEKPVAQEEEEEEAAAPVDTDTAASDGVAEVDAEGNERPAAQKKKRTKKVSLMFFVSLPCLHDAAVATCSGAHARC